MKLEHKPGRDLIYELAVNMYPSLLECFREAISNSYDEGTKKIDLHVSNNEITFEDYGEGIDDVEKFTSFGHATKAKLGGEIIGEKGLGKLSLLRLSKKVNFRSNNGEYGMNLIMTPQDFDYEAGAVNRFLSHRGTLIVIPNPEGVPPIDELANYLKFIRKINPASTKEVNKFLKDSYVELRTADKERVNAVSPRHLNTLIRTTLAIARLHQRQYAIIEDADKAITLMKKMFKQRNISISEADTYVSRQYNRSLDILKEYSSLSKGLLTDEIFEKLINVGSEEEIEKSILDLGRKSSWRENKKWREVVEKLKRSNQVIIVSEKPLVLTFDASKAKLDNWAVKKE